MRIAICDDVPRDVESLSAMLIEYCNHIHITPYINSYSHGLDYLASTERYDIVFIDTYMDQMSGLDTIRAMKKHRNALVVFVSTGTEHAIEAFALNAMHYLVKPIAMTDLAEAMKRCLVRIGFIHDQVLEIKSGLGVVPVSIPSISYIEVRDKISTVHTHDDDIKTYTTRADLLEQLDEKYFIKPQRSYIVNMSFIKSFLYDRVILNNDMEIMLSRSNRIALRDQYQQYQFEMARSIR
ncbi:MAG: response regulator transcription factor [Clostridiales bacterium]|nr:response regulator transcription factor [Clostridiales bacterium]